MSTPTNILLITTDQRQRRHPRGTGSPLAANSPPRRVRRREAPASTAARTQNPLCRPARGDDPHRYLSVDPRRDVQRDRSAVRRRGTLARDTARRARLSHRHHRQGPLRDRVSVLPDGARRIRRRLARVDEEWSGPYFGFGHAELMLFGHNLRIADLIGKWNSIFGPPPFGLHSRAAICSTTAPNAATNACASCSRNRRACNGTTPRRGATRSRKRTTPRRGSRIAPIEWLRTVEDPFFGWVSFTDPHHPMDPPTPWCDQYAPRTCWKCCRQCIPTSTTRNPACTRSFPARARRDGMGEPRWCEPHACEELARMTAGYYGMVARARSQHRANPRRAPRTRRGRRHARARLDRPRRIPGRAPDDLQGPVRL